MPEVASKLPRFQGAALKVAREYRCMTKKQLAADAGCHKEQISRTEAGAQPELLLRESFVEALSFPLAFFHTVPPATPNETVLHYRKGASVSLKNRRQAVAHGGMLARLVGVLEGQVNLPAVRVPNIRVSDGNDIESCAEACRAEWGIHPHAPLTSMGRAAEQAGVVVGLLRKTDDKLQGFSFYKGGRPMIMVRERSAPSRARMTVAHELGHLVMHRGLVNTTEDIEEQAYRFAGAFMVPRYSFLREFPRPHKYFDWRAIVEFKERWGLSIQGSLKRAYDLGVLSPAQLRTGYIEISRFKWRTNEPGETMQPERPHLLQDAVQVCSTLGLSVVDLLQADPIPLDSVADLTGLDLAPVHDRAANMPNVLPLFPKSSRGG